MKLKLLATVAFIAMITVNALANILPLNGNNSGEVSDAYPNLFAPAGFTFSIWSVIYLWTGAFCVYQFVRGRANAADKAVQRTIRSILPYFILSSLLNASWIFAWHYRQIGLSLILISALLLCLLRLTASLRTAPLDRRAHRFMRIPFSIYLGWVSVAVIANVTVWLVSRGWQGFGLSDAFWAASVLIVGAVIALARTARHPDRAYLVVFVWAYFGILAKHVSADGFDERYPLVIGVLLAALGVFVYRLIVPTSAYKK